MRAGRWRRFEWPAKPKWMGVRSACDSISIPWGKLPGGRKGDVEMMKKLLAVTAVAGLVGAPAMAGTLTGAFDSNKYTETFGANAASTYTLDLSITVEKVASVWTDYSGVSLVLDGGATNEDSV